MTAELALTSVLALPQDIAYTRVMAFARRFGEAHTTLAMHAAFPLGLSPELVHLLRVNLVPQAPFIAEADLLLSSLCREAGGGLYEMDDAVRELLLHELVSDAELGPRQLDRVADFVMSYAERAYERTSDPDLRGFFQVQQWAALARLQPGQAARELSGALQAAVEHRDSARTIQLVRIIGELSAPLASQRALIRYAARLKRRLTPVSGQASAGDTTEAAQAVPGEASGSLLAGSSGSAHGRRSAGSGPGETAMAGVLARLREAMTEEVAPVPFAGTGISVAVTGGAQHAGWRGLLLDGIEACRRVVSPLPAGWADRMKDQLDHGDLVTCTTAAEEIAQRLRTVREGREFGTWIQEAVSRLRPTPEGERMIKAIRRLGKVIVTTNYDTLIEDLDPRWESYTSTDNEYGSAWRMKNVVIHPHGVASKPQSIILSSADYSRLDDERLARVLDQAFFSSHRFILIGFGDSLVDPGIEFVRRVMPGEKEGLESFILVTGGELRQLSVDPISPLITPVAYGADFSDLMPFLEELAVGGEREVSQDPEYYQRPARPGTSLLDLATAAEGRIRAVQDALQRAARAMGQVEHRGAQPSGIESWAYEDQNAVHEQLAMSVQAPAERLKSSLEQVVVALEEAELDIGRLTSPRFGTLGTALAPMSSLLSELADQTWLLLGRVREARDDLRARARESSISYRIVQQSLSSAFDSIDQANDIVSSLEEGFDYLLTNPQTGKAERSQQPPPQSYPHAPVPEQKTGVAPDLRLIPVVEEVAAGSPVLATEDLGYLPVPALVAGEDTKYLPLPAGYARRDDAFAVIMSGDSMAGDGVLDGDYLVVVPDQEPENGEMVLVNLGGETGDTTVRRLWHEGATVRLESPNPDYPPIVAGQDAQLVILGKAIGVFRPLAADYARRDDAFAVIMSGDSMAGDGVLDGDYLVVVPDQEPENGEMVLVNLGDETGDTTVRRLWYESATVRLESPNPDYPPIVAGQDAQLRILGRIIGVVRRHIKRSRRN
jgi:SOS-response transcriptional repressor LexA